MGEPGVAMASDTVRGRGSWYSLTGFYPCPRNRPWPGPQRHGFSALPLSDANTQRGEDRSHRKAIHQTLLLVFCGHNYTHAFEPHATSCEGQLFSAGS